MNEEREPFLPGWPDDEPTGWLSGGSDDAPEAGETEEIADSFAAQAPLKKIPRKREFLAASGGLFYLPQNLRFVQNLSQVSPNLLHLPALKWPQ